MYQNRKDNIDQIQEMGKQYQLTIRSFAMLQKEDCCLFYKRGTLYLQE